ncbi:MAG: NgoPII family restriction endonuclease [Clostridiaceae bacterium]|jgi:hypothetical protein|nr:NgoPII family restriction endonuclease [Clostridiaceae bacterium]
MANILTAIKNLIDNPIIELTSHYSGRNRANGVGDALEKFTKDLFANTLFETDEYKKTLKYNEVFSYQGNQNNPPDIMLKNGDSIEVKKVQGNANALALNSSYPKSKLYSNSTMITEACKNCEQWSEKDIIYIVGNTDDSKLKSLWFVYGDCYAANKSTYERVKNTIIDGLHLIPNIELAPTNELGKIKKVDPLGITDLRVRGMWSIFHPVRVFDYLPKMDLNNNFKFYCVMREEKFNSFSEVDKNTILSIKDKNFKISDLKIKNPDNPAKLINIKFMEFYYG